MLVTPHLVESLKKFLKWAIDFSNLEFLVALHLKEEESGGSETDVCLGFGRIHYHLMLYSVKFPKTMDKLIKKNFNIALGETMISKSSYKVEMLTTSSVSFRKEFLRNTKTLLTHGTTIQLHVSGLNQTNTRSNVDCIWEKSQIGGTGNGAVDRADVFEKLEQLETSSSPFKHAISDIVSFLAQNNYGTFTTSQHSSVLRVSVDVTDGQCNCDECFPANSDETSHQRTFQYIDENTILYEQSLNTIFN